MLRRLEQHRRAVLGDERIEYRLIRIAALNMLVEGGRPVRIVDFPDDDPRARPDPVWQPPFMPAAVANGDVESLASRLEAEILLLQGAHRRWMEQHGRSTFGLSGLVLGPVLLSLIVALLRFAQEGLTHADRERS